MSNQESKVPDLELIFLQINEKHFDGFLDPPALQWNSRLRSSAGRFFPGSRRGFIEFPAKIEIASYLIHEAQAQALIVDTLGHEMIHYWLWVRRRPYGHTPEFWTKMREMGVSRYNSVPRVRPFKYLYRCQECLKDFPARRKLGPLACAECCKLYNQGKYDPKYRLVLQKETCS